MPRRLLELEAIAERARSGEEPDALAALEVLCSSWRIELEAQLAEIGEP